MPTVFNVLSFHSELHPGFRHVHTLELEEPALGSGNFGDVYVCTAINGLPPPLPQVVKILREDGTDSCQRGFDTIRKLQQKIIERNAIRTAARQPNLQSLPALRALPQFSFLGEMGGQQILGYSATRLDEEGYIPLAKILDAENHSDLFELYSRLSFEERILLAADMAEGFQALAELPFLHADINAPNLMLDLEHCHLAIIDYDSGAVGDNEPTTFGKQDDWLAPEIVDWMASRTHRGITSQLSPWTDRWAAFIGIHHLLFLGPPLFFFNTYVTNSAVAAYLKDHEWPRIDSDHPLFDPAVRPVYDDYLAGFGGLPQPLQEALRFSINEGFFKPGERRSYQQWASALRASLRGPEISLFTASRGAVASGMATRLSWSVSGAYQITIDHGIGPVDPNGSLEIYPTETRVYTLTARTRQGELVNRRLAIQVWPLPELRSIQVPSCSIDQRIALRVLQSGPPRIHLPVKRPQRLLQKAFPTGRRNA